MDIKDLKQENSRKIVERVVESLKLDEDSGAGITGEFIFCFEKDDNHVRTIMRATPLTLLHLMYRLFETLQNESPMGAYLAEGIFKGMFSQKKDAD